MSSSASTGRGRDVERLHRARTMRSVIANAGYLCVVVILVVGMVLVGLEYWRRGLVVIGSAVATAAVLRAALPTRRQGLLQVRGRWFDVGALAVAAAAILVLALGISPLGTK